MNRSKQDFYFAISFLVCLQLLEDKAEIPVALSLDSRLAISIDRIEIFSSIGKLAAPFRADLTALPEVDMFLATDAMGDASPDVVDAAFGYVI